MKLGIVMLVHNEFRRAEQLARHWAKVGCPVVIHVDKSVAEKPYRAFVAALNDVSTIAFCPRYKCVWGSWGIVAATQAAADQLLQQHPAVQHVYLASGSCLPLRPVQDLIEYLSRHPDTDFIESARVSDVLWTVGGLDAERFTLRFPFSWKKQRALFDAYVKLQRRVGFQRQIPSDLTPHIGSQWWCLTRPTLTALLNDPHRARYERYFRRVLIPDEGYFQTLVRKHSSQIESRSLTLSKFDFQGRPHIFFNDHLQLLRRSDCFVARKIWPQADLLYESFLKTPQTGGSIKSNPGKIDRIFSKAVERRTRGRDGLYMQSRYPRRDKTHMITAGAYSVFHGFTDVFEDFEAWLSTNTGARVHGHLFAADRAHFDQRQPIIDGCLSDHARLRDYNPAGFLTNLIWNTRGQRQCFQFGPSDNQKILPILANDPNAQISIITGTWAIGLSRTKASFEDLRRLAAFYQKQEKRQLEILNSLGVRARVRIWKLAEFADAPLDALRPILDEISPGTTQKLYDPPLLTSLDGLETFLQTLKNEGVNPYLIGDLMRESEAPLQQNTPALDNVPRQARK